MPSVILCVEGVLSDDTMGRLGPAQGDGVRLFQALRSMYDIQMSSTSTNYDAIQHFLLRSCGVKPAEYGRILLAEDHEIERETRLRHMTEARAANYDVRYMITPDPWVARKCLEMGVAPLCCPHPAYSRPSFLPDAGTGRLDWDAIETEVTMGQIRKMGDTRLASDDTVGVDGEYDPDDL